MSRVSLPGLLAASFLFLVAAGCASQNTSALATTEVSVHPGSVLSDVSRCPLGINVNYLTDRPSLFAPDARPLQVALQEMGVHYLRYPGGEKSDLSLVHTAV